MLNHSQSLCAIFVSSAGSLVLAAGQAAVPAATNASATAVDNRQITPVFRAEAFEADDMLRPPTHPPIDQIPALPMPNPQEDLSAPRGGPGNALFHDPATKITTEIPLEYVPRATAGKGAGFVGADGIDTFADLFGPRSFGTMFALSDSIISSHPFRMNVKLVQEYIDAGTGAASYFVCSGGMQDASVVLTAGHCVYNRDNDSTGSDFGFANRVWVYPGWDGDGLELGNPGVLDFYGWGVSNGMVAWTGYTNDGDFDWDVGLLSINRAVGMLTGWYGWRYDDGCSTLGLFFNNPSYPSENCGGGLHTGRQMYNWNGTFDSCVTDNRLQINTSGGCLNALWGGQSGSNAYDIEGDSRYAHAVASTSDRDSYGRYAKLWSGAVTYLNDTFRPNSRGSSLDLQALEFRATPTTITAGNSTSSASAQVPNPTNNNPPSQTYNFNVYLSTNNNISSGDILLADRAYSFNYAAMQNVSLNTGNVTIPKNTPSGTYWLGIELDPGTDSNNSNNDTDLWDAQQITVNGIADIVANTCSAPSGTAYHGDTISVGYNVSNEGGDPSNSVTLDFYASTNTDISGADTFLGSVNIGTFNGGQTKSGSVNLNIPSSITGARYIGYIASASDDAIVNQSNEAYDAVQLNIAGRADLHASYLDALDSQVSLGGSIGVRFNVQNNGTIPSGVYDVDVYASTNSTISAADTLLRTFTRPSLNNGSSSTVIDDVTFPLFMSPGLYYVGMIVEGGVNENNNSNNSAFDSNRVTVVDCPVDFDGNGLLDLADIVQFTQLFQSQDARADFDNNNLWDLADIVQFVSLFNAGCP